MRITIIYNKYVCIFVGIIFALSGYAGAQTFRKLLIVVVLEVLAFSAHRVRCSFSSCMLFSAYRACCSLLIAHAVLCLSRMLFSAYRACCSLLIACAVSFPVLEAFAFCSNHACFVLCSTYSSSLHLLELKAISFTGKIKP
jgi:hypothetical protein